MADTHAKKGDLHHRFQWPSNVFVDSPGSPCRDAGGRVSTGVPPQGRDWAAAVACACSGSRGAAVIPGQPLA